MRCYAGARKYGFVLLDRNSFQECKRIYNIFFMKPCLVGAFLKDKPPDYTAVFLDADVVAVVLWRGFEEWLRVDADLHFYERDWLPEIMSGIFFARNRPWVRKWLVTWAEFLFRQPPGFSSADNGALHLHLVETMNLPGAKQCAHMYANLKAGIENRTPYWSYVECTNKLLGAPGTFRACATVGSSECGVIAIWPRLSFVAIDGFTLDFKVSKFIGPIILHNMKNTTLIHQELYSNLERCEVNPLAYQPRQLYGQRAVVYSECCPDLYPQLNGNNCSQCMGRCMSTFSCSPLQLGADKSEIIAAKRRMNVSLMP